MRLRTKEWCLANGWKESTDSLGRTYLDGPSDRTIYPWMIQHLGTSEFGKWAWYNELIMTKQDIINEFFKES